MDLCAACIYASAGNISHSITTGIDPTGIHRHLEKVTMETLHEGQHLYYKCWISPLEQNPAHKCEVTVPDRWCKNLP